MMQPHTVTCLYGGPLFDGTRLRSNSGILFNRDGILDLFEGAPPAYANAHHVGGRLITPGFVDLHSDALEKCIEMRPGVFFDTTFALQSLDRRLAASGTTTFCHAICFADNELGVRSPGEAERIVQRIQAFKSEGPATVRHRIHARYEVGSQQSAAVVMRLITSGLVDVLSYMDHTPGQGQFNTMRAYLDFYQRAYQLNRSEVLTMAQRKQRQRRQAWAELQALSREADQRGIPLFSHDDDSGAKVELVRRLGVVASEFPINLAAARTAASHGMGIFMGAPNLLRDRSSNGHLRASDAISQGLCHGLLSDYYPESLLQAPFLAARRYHKSLEKMLALVTSQPARWLKGLPGIGHLCQGSPADILVIDYQNKWADVTQTWVSGRCVYQGGQLSVAASTNGNRPIHEGANPKMILG